MGDDQEGGYKATLWATIRDWLKSKVPERIRKHAPKSDGGWLFMISLAGVLCFLTATGVFGWSASRSYLNLSKLNEKHQAEISELSKKAGDDEKRLNDKIATLQTQSQLYKKERDKAQLQLAPWINLANSHLTNTPLTERLDALHEQLKIALEAPSFKFFIDET